MNRLIALILLPLVAAIGGFISGVRQAIDYYVEKQGDIPRSEWEVFYELLSAHDFPGLVMAGVFLLGPTVALFACIWLLWTLYPHINRT